MSDTLDRLAIDAAHDELLDALPPHMDDELSVTAANTILSLHTHWEQSEGTAIANRRLVAALGEAATTKARLEIEAGDTYA